MKSRYQQSLRMFFAMALCSICALAAKAQEPLIDYTPYKTVLENHVVESGQSTRVKYELLKKKPTDLYQFNRAVSEVPLARFQKWGEKDQIAFLINAYNSFTLQLIIENYPVSSIKKIGGFFGNPWKKKWFRFLGEESSLDRIEHEFLRKNYKEPRIHFAVNCASIGCPPLQKIPFEGTRLEEQLASAAKHFVNSSSFNKYDPASHSLMLSSIFKWYGSDFGDEIQLKLFILNQLGLAGQEREVVLKAGKVDFLEYDWNLNEAK